MSTWCAAPTISSYDASAASHDIGCSCASRTKSGSTWKVSAGQDARARRARPGRASRTSGFSVADARSTSPVAGDQLEADDLGGQRRPRRRRCRGCRWRSRPARVCSAMSPMLCSDRPSALEGEVEVLAAACRRGRSPSSPRGRRRGSRQPVGSQQGVLGRRDRGEAVAGADHLDGRAGLARARRTASTTASTAPGVSTCAGDAPPRGRTSCASDDRGRAELMSAD